MQWSLYIQVALNPSALAADDSGHAASVQASGGNKVKLQKGAAVFKDVKVTAEADGEYILRISSSSRKVILIHCAAYDQPPDTGAEQALPLGLRLTKFNNFHKVSDVCGYPDPQDLMSRPGLYGR